MINYVIGDATYPQGEGYKLIVHCCNNLGAWGSGFVVALSNRWPEPESAYRDQFNGLSRPGLSLGDVQFVHVEKDITVVNLIGQEGVGAPVDGIPPVRYDAIFKGMTKLAQFSEDTDFSLHMPRMGAGLAGGKWSIIEAIVDETLVARGIPVTVYDLEA